MANVKYKVSLVVLYCYVIGCKAKWIEHPLSRIKIDDMAVKPFPIFDCTMRDELNIGFVPLRPQCSFEDHKKDVHLMVTSYKAITVDVVRDAESCKKLEVRTKTFKNLVGTKTITSQRKTWKSVTGTDCQKLRLKKPEKTSLVLNSQMYGSIHVIYKYYSHVESVDFLYFLTKIKIRLDVSLNLVKSATGTIHEGCSIDKESCDLKEGGMITWSYDSKLNKEVDCPYEYTNKELCLATEAAGHGVNYLILNCEQSKTRMHLTHNPKGMLEHVQSCRQDHGVKIYESNEKSYISFNLSTSDMADIITKNLTITETMAMYDLNRFNCEIELGAKKCTLDATNVNSSDSVDSISAMNPAFCKENLCKLPDAYVCGSSSEKVLHIIKIQFKDNLDQYAASLKYDNTSFCADILDDKLIIYAAATLKIKHSRSIVRYSLVSLDDQMIEHSSINGFTMKKGYSCAHSDEMISLTSNTYKALTAELRKKKPKTYESFNLCSPQPGTGNMEGSTKITRSTNMADYVLSYTGKHTTGDVTQSFWAEKMEYLYDTIKNGNAEELKRKRSNLCAQQLLDWSLRDSLLKLDVNMYLKTLPGRRAGYRKGHRIVSWPCYSVNEFQIKVRKSGNCSENIPVDFIVNNTRITSYIKQFSNEVTSKKGKMVSCESLTDYIDLGYNLLLAVQNKNISVWSQELSLHNEREYINSPPTYIGAENDIEEDGLISRLAMVELEQSSIINEMGFDPDSNSGLWNSSSDFENAYNKVKTLSLQKFFLSHHYIIMLTILVVTIIVISIVWQTRSIWVCIWRCMVGVLSRCRSENRHRAVPVIRELMGDEDPVQHNEEGVMIEDSVTLGKGKRIVRFSKDIRVDRITQ